MNTGGTYSEIRVYSHVPRVYFGVSSTTLKQHEFVDLDGDGTKEVIQLRSKRDERNQDREVEWILEVNGIEIGRFDDKKVNYMYGKIEVVDLLNEGNREILLYLESTSSAGTAGLNVFKVDKNENKQIFFDPNPNLDSQLHVNNIRKYFEVKYNGNFKVGFVHKQSGLTAVIPLSKERYQDFPQEGIENYLNERISTSIDPISNYEINNAGANKPKEIVTVQEVNGVANADGIATFKTKYVYDSATEKYIPKEVALYSLAPEPIRQLVVKKLP